MKISQKITSSVQRLIAERIPTNRIPYYLYPFTLKTTQTDFQNYFWKLLIILAPNIPTLPTVKESLRA